MKKRKTEILGEMYIGGKRRLSSQRRSAAVYDAEMQKREE